jgi:hypothetical protein
MTIFDDMITSKPPTDAGIHRQMLETSDGCHYQLNTSDGCANARCRCPIVYLFIVLLYFLLYIDVPFDHTVTAHFGSVFFCACVTDDNLLKWRSWESVNSYPHGNFVLRLVIHLIQIHYHHCRYVSVVLFCSHSITDSMMHMSVKLLPSPIVIDPCFVRGLWDLTSIVLDDSLYGVVSDLLCLFRERRPSVHTTKSTQGVRLGLNWMVENGTSFRSIRYTALTCSLNFWFSSRDYCSSVMIHNIVLSSLLFHYASF